MQPSTARITDMHKQTFAPCPTPSGDPDRAYRYLDPYIPTPPIVSSPDPLRVWERDYRRVN